MDRFEQVKARFWALVDVRGPDDCWPWLGRVNPYGVFSARGFPLPHTTTATRWAFFFLNGRPPRGELAHSCDNPPCMNPTHVKESTKIENEREKTARGRRPTGIHDTPCRHCGGPRLGRYRRLDGREFAFCVPCKNEGARRRWRERAAT